MSDWDHNKVTVGDKLYLATSAGWRSSKIIEYTVARKTPSGQVVAVSDFGGEKRINPRGSIIGKDSWSRERFVPREEAEKIRAEYLKITAWNEALSLLKPVEQAIRKLDPEGVQPALNALTAAIAKASSHG